MNVRKEYFRRNAFLLSALFSKSPINLNFSLCFVKVFKCEK
jgi:hypothetical protein